jgi:N-acetylglucosamine kinase-like BadF-type ATPase
MTSASPIVVGIDGGATRTRYLLADETGKPLGRVEGEGSLLGAGEDEGVGTRIAQAVETLVRQVGRSLPVDALCAGLAGAAGRREAARSLESRLEREGVARSVRILPDAEPAFLDAFGDGAGILLVAGTGSIGLARRGGGALERVGGWGALLGDEGSGYHLGLAGLRAAVRAVEGRGPGSELVESIPEGLGLGSFGGGGGGEALREILIWSEGAGKSGIAALAPMVVAAADRGDVVAESIVMHAVEAITAHAVALRSRVTGDPPPPVALVGGLVEPQGPLRLRVVRSLQLAGFTVLSEEVDPTREAVRIAIRSLG